MRVSSVDERGFRGSSLCTAPEELASGSDAWAAWYAHLLGPVGPQGGLLLSTDARVVLQA